MYKTVLSLQKCCIDFVCENLEVFFELQHTAADDSDETKLVFRDPESCFNADLSDLFLSTLSEMGRLSDTSLLLFDPHFTALHRVIIHNSSVTSRGLSVLQGHRVSHLEITDSKDMTIPDIITCLGEWTLSNLRILNVSGASFLNDSKIWSSSLSRLRTLHTLNVSFTNLSQEGLEIIAENLSCLAVLDISGNGIRDISPLRECRHHLKSLSMYNLHFHKSDPVAVISELSLLVHLDVSQGDVHESMELALVFAEAFPVADYLCRCEANPNLVSLDVSGSVDVEPHVLKSYLEAHKGLNFLGLALTSMSAYEIFQPESLWYRSRPEFKVSGNANVAQLLESLRRYVSRQTYMFNTLHEVFILTRHFREPRENIIELILPVMKSHSKISSLQLTGTACLANLLRDAHYEPNLRIHPVLLSECVEVSLTAMDNFPAQAHVQLQRNALLVICNGRVLEDVSFDRFRCLQVILKCMCLYQSRDASLTRMSVAVCSILIRKISREQVAALVADAQNVRRLLELVREGFMNYETGVTLKFTLAALWSLTDECPQACSVFVAEDGVELLMELMRLIDGKETETCVELRRKCLGVLSNIAEADQARHKIIQADMIKLIRGMLHVETLDVSYLAADIVAHLCTEDKATWTRRGCLDRDEILQDLETVVLTWDQGNKIPVTYRTFRPFYLLLQCEATAVKLYSLWAIHSFCSSDGARYLTLLDSESGHEHIQALMTSANLDPRMKIMCQEILDLLEKHRGGSLT